MTLSPSKRVTIVVPAFNAERFLDQTLISACEAQPGEIIVINDGSTDSTLKVAESFKQRFSNIKIISTANNGESSAINLGLSQVKTEYVLILSADDLISPRLLSTAAAILDSDGVAVAAYPSWKVIDGDGLFLAEHTNLDFSVERLLGQLICLPGPGSVIRTCEMSGGRNTLLKQIGDFEQWIRLSHAGHFVHIPEVLASWRSHGENMTLLSFGEQLSMELNILLSTAKNLFGPEGSKPVSTKVWNTFLSNWYCRKAIAESSIPGSRKSSIYFFKSITKSWRTGKFLPVWISIAVETLHPKFFKTLVSNGWLPSTLMRNFRIKSNLSRKS